MNTVFKIIEIVGPPGSGKSSLTNQMRLHYPKFQVESFPYYKRIDCIPFYLRNLFSLSPTLLRLKKDSAKGWLTPRDIVSIIILNGWASELKKKLDQNPGTTLVLDEGAVTIAAWLRGFGSGYMESANMQPWWKHIYAQWASMLDLVIQLQTPGPVLMQRIRSRDHTWDYLSNEDTLRTLETMKSKQDEVLATLATLAKPPSIIRASTLGKSPEQIGAEILSQLG